MLCCNTVLMELLETRFLMLSTANAFQTCGGLNPTRIQTAACSLPTPPCAERGQTCGQKQENSWVKTKTFNKGKRPGVGKAVM